MAMHTVIAYKISKDPSLLEQAKEYQAQRRKTHEPGRVPRYEEEWAQILTLPWLQVAAFLIAVTEDAIRLRSSSPFPGILTQEERIRIIEAFRS